MPDPNSQRQKARVDFWILSLVLFFIALLLLAAFVKVYQENSAISKRCTRPNKAGIVLKLCIGGTNGCAKKTTIEFQNFTECGFVGQLCSGSGEFWSCPIMTGGMLILLIAACLLAVSAFVASEELCQCRPISDILFGSSLIPAGCILALTIAQFFAMVISVVNKIMKSWPSWSPYVILAVIGGPILIIILVCVGLRQCYYRRRSSTHTNSVKKADSVETGMGHIRPAPEGAETTPPIRPSAGVVNARPAPIEKSRAKVPSKKKKKENDNNVIIDSSSVLSAAID